MANTKFVCDNGKPSRLSVRASDISVQKHTEEALKESEKLFRAVFEAAPLGIAVTNSEGKFFEVNDSFHHIFGYTKDDLADMTLMDISHSDDRKETLRLSEEVYKGDWSFYQTEKRYLRKDGQPVWTAVRATAIKDNGGKIQYWLNILEDITERKQAEEANKKLEAQLQHVQKMEAIGTLAGGIAHDFNNLLMTIQGNASLMLYDMDIKHPHYETLRSIEKAISSGAKLTKQLLGYAMKGNYQVKPLNLNQLVEETASAISRTKKDVMIHLGLSDELLSISADQGQMEQVLLNLFINALDAMPGGGKISLKSMNVTHENIKGKHYDPNPKPGNYVLLTVADTGIGMDKKTQERIFDPFFTTKEMGMGTGLGLASVYGIIKSHGGYIDVESEEGRGTCFSIYLPASGKKISETDDTATQIIEGSGNILFVDDEEMVLETGVKMLKKLGYTVFESKSGTAAVEVYKENKDKVDMVILDMIMPQMSGGEVYDKIKAINPNVKVLLSSGYSLEGQATEILKRGCNGFIQKPFRLKELSGKIKEILARE